MYGRVSAKMGMVIGALALHLAACAQPANIDDAQSNLRACRTDCEEAPTDPPLPPPPIVRCSNVCTPTASCDTECEGTSCFDAGMCNFPRPSLPLPSKTVVSIGAGVTCAVKPTGALTCWGTGVVAESPPTGTFVSVSVGLQHACALKPDGEPVCWGIIRESPPAVPFLSLSAGSVLFSSLTCGVMTNHSIRCWGTDPSFDLMKPPIDKFDSVEIDYLNGCGHTLDGRIACWGSFRTSGIGDVATYAYETTPAITDFENLSGNYCGLRSGGVAFCFYHDTWAGPVVKETLPGTFIAVSGAPAFYCGIRANGTLECFGNVAVAPPAGTFTSVLVKGRTACAVRTDDTVACWGANQYGEADVPPGI